MVQLANNIGIMLSCRSIHAVVGTGALLIPMGLFPVWVNYGSSLNLPSGQMQWRMPFIVQIAPGFLFIFCMVWQPESPR